MRAELVNLNPCAVPFLSRAVVNLSWDDCNSMQLKLVTLLWQTKRFLVVVLGKVFPEYFWTRALHKPIYKATEMSHYAACHISSFVSV